MHKALYRLWVMWLALSHPIRKTYTATVCGHQTKKTGMVSSHGEHYPITLPLSENDNPCYCLVCISKMSIQCVWCENTIRIGDPITLSIPQESFRVPLHAVRYDKDERYLIGCLGPSCAGADHKGYWMPPGVVAHMPSSTETPLPNGTGDQILIARNFSNPIDLGKAF